MVIITNPNIPNQEELALALLSRLLAKPWKCADKIGILTNKQVESLLSCTTIDEVGAISPTVVEYILDTVEANWEKRRTTKAAQWFAKAHNRTEYLPTGTLEHREALSKPNKETGEQEKIHRWHGEIRLQNAGLLSRMVESLYGAMAEPVALSVINMLPPSDELGLKHAPVNPIHWENMLDMGMAVSGERVAWQMNSPAWALLMKCFPQAIDLRAYNHSLNAPLISGGYIPDVDITFTNFTSLQPIGTMKGAHAVSEVKKVSREDLVSMALRDIKPKHHKSMSEDMDELFLGVQSATSWDEMFMLLDPWELTRLLTKHRATAYTEVPMEDDGSGRYHPDCPQLAELIGRYGLVPMQIRAVDPKHGIFAKGIVVPDCRALDDNGQPGLCLSWMQIKGRHKGLAATRKKENARFTKRMHVGILRTWDRKRFMTGCFELLENISAVAKPGEIRADYIARKRQVNDDLHSLVDETMEDLGKDGISGLLASIAKDDKMLSLVVKLLAKAESRGIHIDPMSIDRVRQAMDQKLQRRLWGIAQGAGMDGRQLVIVIDGGLTRGQVVCTHYKVGSELATWRFPLVLAQGLQTHRVVAPRPHHLLLNGEGVDQTIFMNPTDVLDMQGDDDGDIVAASTDKRIIRLFQERIDNRRYAIEPVGEKLNMTSDSKEGLEYIRSTPMGPVGQMTMNRAKLLAVGDLYGALAMSVGIQEAIDKAKRLVRYTDWEKACVIDNWKLIDGVYRIHYEGSHNYLDERTGETSDDLPMKVIAKWMRERLARFGCQTGKGGNTLTPDDNEATEGSSQSPIGWRIQWGVDERADGSQEIVKLTKRIQPSTWTLAREQQHGYEGGNLVHKAHDRSWNKWQEVESNFGDLGTEEHHVDEEMQQSVSNLLIRLLREEGATVNRPDMSWFEYLDVRALAGITEFGEELKRALAQDTTEPDGSENSDRYANINAAYELLAQRMKAYEKMAGYQGLVDIWCMETTPHYRVKTPNQDAWYTTDREEIPEGAKWTRVNNPNHAINAICWPGSPILEYLGIEGEDVCGFLTADRLRTVLEHVTAQPDAFQALADAIWQTKVRSTHERITKIPIWDCAHCKEALQTALVRQFRSGKRRAEKAFLGRIVGTLNQEGNTRMGVGDASSLGIDVAEFLRMDLEDLEALAEGLSDSNNRVDRAKVRIIRRILDGDDV